MCRDRSEWCEQVTEACLLDCCKEARWFVSDSGATRQEPYQPISQFELIALIGGKRWKSILSSKAEANQSSSERRWWKCTDAASEVQSLDSLVSPLRHLYVGHGTSQVSYYRRDTPASDPPCICRWDRRSHGIILTDPVTCWILIAS